jgi:hypothetical protein
MKRTIFWIKAEDELPEYKNIEVLVCDSLDKVTTGYYLEDKGWQVHGESRINIEWWAPLPLPPSQVGITRLDHGKLVGWVD